MYIESRKIVREYQRVSKQGLEHVYSRISTVLVFSCDNCGARFERARGQIDPRRVNNDCYHVCSDCDQKKFAQAQGVERRRIWNTPVNSNIKI